MCCYFLVPCSGKFGTLSEWSKLLLLATFINVIWWSHICLISLLNPNCFGLAFMHSLDLLWAFCGYFSWGRWDFWFLTWPWLLLLLCLSYVSGFFFFFFGLYEVKSTCWDQTHCIEGKNVRCFLQTIDDKLLVLKLVEKELVLGGREGENEGISSSTLVLLSCKLILLRGKKVARL